MGTLADIALGLPVAGLLVTRQLQPRPATESSLAVRLGLDAVTGHTGTIPPATSSILLDLAVTLGTQREIIRRRAARLTPATPPAHRPPNPQTSSSHRGRSAPCAPCHR